MTFLKQMRKHEATHFPKIILNTLYLFILIGSFFLLPFQVNSLVSLSGEELFTKNCSGCHTNGGNIIRRGKTLKVGALKRYGIDNPEAIAKIANEGIGIMSGYKNSLKDGEDKILSLWIWQQAQNAWVQG